MKIECETRNISSSHVQKSFEREKKGFAIDCAHRNIEIFLLITLFFFKNRNKPLLSITRKSVPIPSSIAF